MSDLIGQYVDRYHIIEKLGIGGMATVYKAWDSRLERDVAIKFIRPEAVNDEMFLKRFEREAKALAHLSHPNIVKVLDYGDFNGSPYLVMEFVRGDTLKAKLLGNPIPWREAARMLMPVAEALDYTHKQNIIHRDVKPSNFLMTESNHLLLSDFGIAKLLDNPEAVQLTGTGIGIGTPEYMAPEQGMGGTIDRRSDVYSLGIVFYEMVTGHKPYSADTPMAVMYKQIADPLPPPRQYVPNLPENVEHILFKSLAKKPADRYQDMDSFYRALQEIVETADYSATRIGVQPPIQPITDPMRTAARPADLPPSPFQSQPAVTHPPVTAPAQPVAQTKKSSKKWIIWVLLGLAVVCIGVVAVIGGFGALVAMFGTPPEGLAVSISMPPSVELGKEFQTVVTLRNEGSKEIRISEIQIPKAFLDVASLNTTYPMYTEGMVYNSTETTGYSYDLAIAPGSSSDIVFYFSPNRIADVTSEWNVYVGTRSATAAVRLAVVEASTNTPTVTIAPTFTLQPPTEMPSMTPSVVYGWSELWVDDFSDPESGFYIGESEDRAFAYVDGEYRITVIKPSWLAWVYLGYSLTDVQMNIDAKILNSNGVAAYGLLCRYQEPGNMYGFEISEDGTYTIWLRNNDEYTNLVNWTYDSRIDGRTWQKMTIECIGDSLTLKLDDQVIASATDSTLASGDVGVMAESDTAGNSLITFDNFGLYEK